MLLMPGRENHSSRVPSFVCTSFLQFGGLKMRILPTRVTHISRGTSFVWAYFCSLVPWNCEFCRVL